VRHLILGAGSLGVAGLTLISLLLNYDFSMRIGGQLFALGSVGLDLFKIALPVIAVIACTAAGHSWTARGALALCALAIWLPVTAFSLQSAGGAALLNRTDSTGSRTGLIEKRKGLDAERNRILNKNPWSAQVEKWKALPSAAITAEITGYKINWMWEASGHCEKAESTKTRSYCQIFHTMKAAREVALEVEADRARLTAIEQELGKTPVLVESDPLSKAVGDLAKVDPKWVVYAWASLLAFLLEFVPNIGPALLMLAYKLSEAEAKPLVAEQAKPFPACSAKRSAMASATLAIPLEPAVNECENSFTEQVDSKVVDFGQYRSASLAKGRTPMAKPLPDFGHKLVLAAARELGLGEHPLSKIMKAVEGAAAKEGVPPPRYTRVGTILAEQGHENCGRRRIGNIRTTVYNLTEQGLDGAATL
jgi:hypothetical protein